MILAVQTLLNKLTASPWLCIDWSEDRSIKLDQTSSDLIPLLNLHIIFMDSFLQVFKLSINSWFRNTRIQLLIYTEICINSPSQFKHNDVRLQHWLHDCTPGVFPASSHMPKHYACHVITSFFIPLSYIDFSLPSCPWLFLCHYWTHLTSMKTTLNTLVF